MRCYMKVLLCLEDDRNTYKQECPVAYLYTLVFDSSDSCYTAS
jgi:hypothetical protein